MNIDDQMYIYGIKILENSMMSYIDDQLVSSDLGIERNIEGFCAYSRYETTYVSQSYSPSN